MGWMTQRGTSFDVVAGKYELFEQSFKLKKQHQYLSQNMHAFSMIEIHSDTFR